MEDDVSLETPREGARFGEIEGDSSGGVRAAGSGLRAAAEMMAVTPTPQVGLVTLPQAMPNERIFHQESAPTQSLYERIFALEAKVEALQAEIVTLRSAAAPPLSVGEPSQEGIILALERLGISGNILSRLQAEESSAQIGLCEDVSCHILSRRLLNRRRPPVLPTAVGTDQTLPGTGPHAAPQPASGDNTASFQGDGVGSSAQANQSIAISDLDERMNKSEISYLAMIRSSGGDNRMVLDD